MIVFLIGPRCAGKTTMGKALAQHMNLSFTDIDDLVVKKAGCSIPEIVEKQGWEGFRKLESEALKEAAENNTVIATGGGIVMDEDNRAFMRNAGTVMYLKAMPMVLAERLEKAPDRDQRPSITGKDPVEEITEVLAEREPHYQGISNYVIDANPSTDTVLGAMVTHLLQFSIFNLIQGAEGPIR